MLFERESMPGRDFNGVKWYVGVREMSLVKGPELLPRCASCQGQSYFVNL